MWDIGGVGRVSALPTALLVGEREGEAVEVGDAELMGGIFVWLVGVIYMIDESQITFSFP